jgi:hypothetical protein
MPSPMDRIRADLRRIGRTFDMAENGLGESLLKAFTDGVKDTIAREETPDGKPWDQLSPDYERWKAKAFPGQPIGFLEETMADPDEIEGEPEITAEEASTTYGKSDTAREHASWFQRGDEDNNHPPRPFWGFTAESRAAVRGILAKRLSDSVRG